MMTWAMVPVSYWITFDANGDIWEDDTIGSRLLLRAQAIRFICRS